MISENFNKARHGSLTGNGCGGSIATIEHPSPGSFIMNHYKEGDKIGSCVFIRRTGFKPSRALFRCECGNEFETAITSVKSGRTKSCGCKSSRLSFRERITKHGLHNHSLYRVWGNIKTRCYNKSVRAYKWYGGCGITICDEWKNDFKAFYDYVIKLPGYGSEGLTLDRINSDGNYEPGNLRFANKVTQILNRNHRNNKTGYCGVYKNESSYISKICTNYKLIHLGSFDTPEQAVEARNKYIIENDLKQYPIQKIKP